MRIIDADELTREICRDQCERDGCGSHCELINYVENAPTVGGWISVEDEQPQKTGLYLTWCRSVYKDGFYRISEYNAEEHGWYDFIHHDFNETTTRFWMPLPEPPKEAR